MIITQSTRHRVSGKERNIMENKNEKLIKFLLMLVMLMIIALLIVIFAKIMLWCGTGGTLGNIGGMFH